MSVFGSSSWGGNEREYVPMTTRDTKRSSTSLRILLIRLLPPAIILAIGVLIGSNFPFYLSVYNRRSSTASSLLPRALPPLTSSSTTDQLLSLGLPPPEEPIPNIVHYVYGLADDQPDFPYFAYLAMRSALVSLKPDRVYFHCIHEPSGYWWERVKDWEGWEDEEGVTRGLVEVKMARDVQWIGKSRRPVVHFAHKADIIRLEVLLEYGGIYIDIDTFILKSFAAASLLQYDTVLGLEAHGLTFLGGPGSDDEMRPKGLCNAIIVSRKGASFLTRWLESYEGFREDKWTEHSVEMPWTLAQVYPTSVTVLSERAFFWPLWTDDHIHAVYATTQYDFEASGQLAYHAWESKARPYLSRLDPSTIGHIATSFTRMARKFQEPDEEARWRAAGKEDGAGSGTGVDEGVEEGEEEEVMGGQVTRGRGLWRKAGAMRWERLDVRRRIGRTI
ncbi:hypothetical protein L198_00497 [Cryptococcus wingfieldii CBS 7118]|uniref:Glycosyl transferase n=1 Tax=Cryptococcus wingfieldii CBS 7118 TaxID=1295528 RepID=A0A1E3K6F3_9TREE|nr:hypothetical protein L198_00497 [Cryptococcus wingfieldii CBS 7118]ODO08764.1 hypothetical protein L198_00497 [Cryptococcus wingfieldii CBS 7118]